MAHKAYTPGTILEIGPSNVDYPRHVVVLSSEVLNLNTGQVVACAIDLDPPTKSYHRNWMTGYTVNVQGSRGNIIGAQISRINSAETPLMTYGRLRGPELKALQYSFQQNIVCGAILEITDPDYNKDRKLSLRTGQVAMVMPANWKEGEKLRPFIVIGQIDTDLFLCCPQMPFTGPSCMEIKRTSRPGHEGRTHYIRYDSIVSVHRDALRPSSDFVERESMDDVMRAVSDMLDGVWRPQSSYLPSAPMWRPKP